MTILILSCLLSIILLSWFKSDAAIAYGKLFGLKKIMKIDEFEKTRNEEDITLNYPRFLRIKYNLFFINLITCPLCLSFWISLLFSIIINNVLLMPIIYNIGLILYGIIIKLLW